MSDPKHELLRKLFDLVIAAPVDQRQSVLNRECGDDLELRQRVEAMIEAAEDPQFLSTPTEISHGFPPSPTISDAPGASPGTLIGPYKLLQRIGEGGFGSVFMAMQEKPIARKVALKIIKLGMDTRQVVARFEQERQALAMMDHPNIAKVFDAGMTESGRPFFVMELCTGEPIEAYCDRHNLPIEDRLELFAQVCNAVQHAHTKGIIHRDIKPSNVLVSTQDGRPSAKVIDFGIAKATASKLTEKTLFTEHKQLMGTPEYMSPEQAEGSLDIDTRTDVYSLGVLLYELLTGCTPFDSKELRSAAYGEIQRMIREVDPPKPSTRLSQNSDTIANIAAHRKTEPRKLGNIVRGELDWIVMKALEKDRQRRYETATGLAMDIKRYLAGEAVVAAPLSATYRFRKFVRRNRVAVTTITAVAASLLIGATAFALQANAARIQRDRATQEAARATAMNSFLTQMLVAADPEVNGSRQVTVLDLLGKASLQADRTLTDQPQVEAAARTLLGSTFRSLGRMDEASAQLERALSLRAAGVERNTASHADTLAALGLVMQAKGDEHAALQRFEQALAILLPIERDRSSEIVTIRINIARAHQHLSQFAEAERSLDEADASLARRSAGADPGQQADIAAIRSDLAGVWKGDLVAAEAIMTQEVALRRQSNQPASLAKSLNNLAVAKLNRNKLNEARALYEEAVEIAQREYGEMHHLTASFIENLANVYRLKGDYDKSMEAIGRVVAIREKIFGADSLPAAKTRLNLGALAITRKDYRLGIEMTDSALPIFRKYLGEQHVDVAQALRSRAICFKNLDDLDSALRDDLAALAIYDAVTQPTNVGRLRTLQEITDLYCLKGATADAERTADLAMKALDPTNPDHIKIRKSLTARLNKARGPTTR